MIQLNHRTLEYKSKATRFHFGQVFQEFSRGVENGHLSINHRVRQIVAYPDAAAHVIWTRSYEGVHLNDTTTKYALLLQVERRGHSSCTVGHFVLTQR